MSISAVSLKKRLGLSLLLPALGFLASLVLNLWINESGIYYRGFSFELYLLKNSVKAHGLLWTLTDFRLPPSPFVGFVYASQPYFVDYSLHAVLDMLGIPVWFYLNFGTALYVAASIFFAMQFAKGNDVYLLALTTLLPPIMMNDLLAFQGVVFGYALILISLGLLSSPTKVRLISAGLVLGLMNFTYFSATWFAISLLLVFALFYWRKLKTLGFTPLVIVIAFLAVFQPSNFLVLVNEMLPSSMRIHAIQIPTALQAVPPSIPTLPPIVATPFAWRHSSLLPFYFLPFLMAIPLYVVTIVVPGLLTLWRRFRNRDPMHVPEKTLLMLGIASLIFLAALYKVDMYGRLFNYLPLMLLPGIYLLIKEKPATQKKKIIAAVLVAELLINIAYFSTPPNHIDYSSSEIRAVQWASNHLTGTIFVDVTRAALFYLRGYYNLQGPYGDADAIIQTVYYSIDNANATRNALKSRNATYILITDSMFVSGLVPMNIPTIPIPQGVLNKFGDTRYFLSVYSMDGSYIFFIK